MTDVEGIDIETLRSLERERLERLAAMGTMVAGFAHEVRNPVAALRSLVESLAEELADANMSFPHVSRMITTLERIERLVKTSLQFGRPAPPNLVRTRPEAILDAAIDAIRPRTNAWPDPVAVTIEPALPPVYVDETQIVQVLVILLNNALDAVAEPRRVSVHVSPARRFGPDEDVRFEVHDDGGGIAPDIVERVFDPFFTTKAAGTGLGLSIAHQIVSENGGSIDVTSEPGATVFTITLPCAVRS